MVLENKSKELFENLFVQEPIQILRLEITIIPSNFLYLHVSNNTVQSRSKGGVGNILTPGVKPDRRSKGVNSYYSRHRGVQYSDEPKFSHQVPNRVTAALAHCVVQCN